MAVDTRSKRASAIMLAPWSIALPAPLAGIDQADRQHVAFTYRGILAGSVVVVSATLRKAIEAELLSLAGITSVVSTRIYPDHPPQSWNYATGPTLAFQVISHEFDVDLDGKVLSAEARVQLTTRCLNKADGLAVVQAIRSSMVGLGGVTWSGLPIDYTAWAGKRCYPAPVQDGSDSQIYLVSVDLTIGHQPET